MECPPGAHLQVAGGPSDESTSMSSSNNEPSLQPTSSTLRQDQPDLSMSYNQLLAHQYHQSHALPPSSHLPPHYHATPLHFAEHPYEGNTAGGSGSSAQEVHTEPLQRILTWQNGMSLATQQPASGASPHYPADAPPPPRPSSTSTASGSKAFASGPNRARALTAPRTISPLPPGSIPAAASSLPPQGINDSTHFQDSLPPLPAAGRLPQAIHFHPPPQATLTLSPSHSALGLQPPPVPPVLPRTIDCNPSLSFTRHASLNFGSEARRSESSSSISPSQSQHQYPNHSFQPHLMHAGSSSASPQPRQIRRAADWDETATPLRTGHARFQSASNVRGAPTEASDGTPGPKFVWNAHGRLATMESIASSQWVRNPLASLQ